MRQVRREGDRPVGSGPTSEECVSESVEVMGANGTLWKVSCLGGEVLGDVWEVMKGHEKAGRGRGEVVNNGWRWVCNDMLVYAVLWRRVIWGMTTLEIE